MSVSIMNIKRLDLELWMYPSKKFFVATVSDGKYVKIKPILNRDGWFKKGKECWFEAEGQAYTCPKETFDYQFKILSVRELSKQEIDALAVIFKTKFATLHQREMHCFHLLHGNKFNINESRRKKRFKDFKKKVDDKKLSIN